MKVKVAPLCLTLCDFMDYTVHGILQARILECVPFPSPGDLPNPGIKPRFPALQVDSSPAEPKGKLKNTGVESIKWKKLSYSNLTVDVVGVEGSGGENLPKFQPLYTLPLLPMVSGTP